MSENRRVVVIDDDDLICAHVVALLQPEGFQVFEATRAAKGLALIAETNPAVVLVDMIMPDKDGVELIMEIRRNWPDLRVIAMSGGGRLSSNLYLDIAGQMGASACLSKPLSLPTLLGAFRD
jgi:DNA-binding response OmpR family regulator